MRVGRIPYINCYPIYGAIDRGIVPLNAQLVTGVPSALNDLAARGQVDVSVVSAVEYARDAGRYLLLPDLAITSDGPVRSVLLLSRRPAESLAGRTVLLSRSSMTSAALLRLLFEHVWRCQPVFAAGDAEITDLDHLDAEPHDARLVIGDAALVLGSHAAPAHESYPYVYDLGLEWKQWTGLPFVFAVWVAQRSAPVREALDIHARLIEARDWGLGHRATLADQAAAVTGVARRACADYLSGLDYRLSYAHLAGLTDFFRRLASAGIVPDGSLSFLPAA
ncbi:MAG TPA: menaquinone biosynthesis protein [Gemmatimonadaceae bacterium]|nr:menaquinone biosynthesis protein [Gemmatimonadaceae bacterium]